MLSRITMGIAQTLVKIAKSVEPASGFFGYLDLVKALRSTPVALTQFTAALASVRPEELDAISDADEQYGWIIMGAADALDLLPTDPRLFASAADVARLPDDKVLDALCRARILNDTATVSRLALRADVNELDHHKQTALCYAVGNNHPECVRLLLQHGADPNRRQNWGDTALHICASTESSKEIVDMLLAAGGDVNVRNDAGRSALDLLCKHRRRDWPAS